MRMNKPIRGLTMVICSCPQCGAFYLFEELPGSQRAECRGCDGPLTPASKAELQSFARAARCSPSASPGINSALGHRSHKAR